MPDTSSPAPQERPRNAGRWPRTHGRWGLAARGWGVALGVALLSMAAPAPARAAATPTVSHKGQAVCRDIALTYDAEFSSTTQTLANNLDELGVRSTWFLVGDSVAARLGLVRQVAARHQIGNHTNTHARLTTLPPTQVRAELAAAHAAIAQAAGRSPEPFWRPPYGAYNSDVKSAAAAADYPQVILWSIDTRDWSGPSAETIRNTILTNAAPGAIVLMHGFPPQTPAATRLAVAALRARGYQFLTVSEILGRDRDQRDFGGDSYVVQSGDTMGQIAHCHNAGRRHLLAYNEVTTVPPGYRLRVPHPDEVIIRVQGVRQEFPVYSRLRGGQPYAHFRLAERLGGQVTFTGGRVVIERGDLRIEVTPGQSVARVNGTGVNMGSPVVADGDHVLLPVRFLAARLGAWVSFNPATQTVQVLR